MNLNELRDKAFKTACEKGFHDKELSNEHFLCLVISELMEAVEADRKGKRADVKLFNMWQNSPLKIPEDTKTRRYMQDFEEFIKNTIEDELADACIRLFDLAGLRNINLVDFNEEEINDARECCDGETFTESIYNIATIPVRFEYEYDYSFDKQLNSMLLNVIGLSNYMGIDLLWHIEQKMLYNESREKMHGKKY